MLKLKLTYPDKDEELAILRRMARSKPALQVEPVITAADIFSPAGVWSTRSSWMGESKSTSSIWSMRPGIPTRYRLALDPFIRYGASPRATVFLAVASKAQALLAGRAYVIPDDIKEIAPDVLRHRIIPTYEAEALGKTSEDLLSEILKGVPAP